MLSEYRKNRLEPVLKALKALDGIDSVQEDDFNIIEINVFLELTPESWSEKRVNHFIVGLRQLKHKISKVCAELGVRYRFLDWPTVKYESMNGEKYRMGYDKSTIKLGLII